MILIFLKKTSYTCLHLLSSAFSDMAPNATGNHEINHERIMASTLIIIFYFFSIPTLKNESSLRPPSFPKWKVIFKFEQSSSYQLHNLFNGAAFAIRSQSSFFISSSLFILHDQVLPQTQFVVFSFNEDFFKDLHWIFCASWGCKKVAHSFPIFVHQINCVTL